MTTILIVEDDPSQCLLYAKELRADGYTIVTAQDGREALEVVEKSKPDLVVMDVSMPGIDGIEAMSRMLAKDHKLPIILNTAYATYRESFRSWSADAYVVKSSDLTELKTTIKKVLESRGLKLEPRDPKTMTEQRVTRQTLVIVLGGGQGERLYPLTRDRSKPAVPFGGSYRIIDFTLSNCVNSGLRRVYVLTQYKSFSLDRHLRLGWTRFDEEIGEFIVPIPPQQRIGERWYLGTADAIFQNIYTLEQERPKYVLVLAGDHIYKMNYMAMLGFHREKGAEATVACVEVPISEGRRFGVVTVDETMRIVGFDEKPANPKPLPGRPDVCLASMGIYAFNTTALVQLVSEDAKRDSTHDFGRDILPRIMRERPIYAYLFQDENRKAVKYWRDIGTLDAYFQANMDLVAVDPLFNLYDEDWPIRTHSQQRPPAKFVFDEVGGRKGTAVDSIVSHGCILAGGRVSRSVLSPGVLVEANAEIEECILMNDVVVGAGSRLRRVIVDKQIIIAPGARVGFDPAADRKKFTVTDSGIVVIPKGVPRTDEFWRA